MSTPEPHIRTFRWVVGDSFFEAAPEVGARLMRWRHRDQEILHWPDDLRSSRDVSEAWGGNPILFPFAARCFVEGEPYLWTTADGVLHPMPMHGIARQGKFIVTELAATGFTATFSPAGEAKSAYPFEYTFSVIYRFSSTGLSCDLVLENRDSRPIPWCAGHHFFFKAPLAPCLTKSDHTLTVDAGRACLVGLPTRGRLVDIAPFPKATPLDDPALANAVIHCSLRSQEAVLGSGPGGLSVVVRHHESALENPHAAFVTWSQPDAPFYCIEPWMGPSNAPEHGLGLQYVPPGERAIFSVEVELQSLPPEPYDAQGPEPKTS